MEILKAHCKKGLPYIALDKKKNKPIGFAFDILDGAARYNNFSYICYWHLKSSGYGSLSNGTWTGSLGLVQKQIVDISLSPGAVNYERHKTFSFSSVVSIEPSRFLVGVPRSLTSSSFTVDSIGDMLGLILGIISSLAAVVIAVKALEITTGEKVVQILELFANLLQKGSPVSPTIWSGRLLLAVWRISCWIIGAAIATFLTSSLTVTRKSEYLKAVSDIFKFPHLVPYTSPYSNQWDFFKLSNDRASQEIYFRMKNQTRTLKGDELMNSILKGRIILAQDEQTIRKFVEQNLKLIIKEDNRIDVTSAYMEQTMAFAYGSRKSQRFWRSFDGMLGRYRDSGILMKYERDMNRKSQFYFSWRYNRKCNAPGNGMSCEDLVGSLYLLAFGLLLSALCCFCEKLISKCYH